MSLHIIPALRSLRQVDNSHELEVKEKEGWREGGRKKGGREGEKEARKENKDINK